MFTQKLPPVDADIIVAPGGYKGIYTIGICHYIKNHFNIKDKKILGFSAGSFNAIFMHLNSELDDILLRSLFALDKPGITLAKFLNNIVDNINRMFKYDDFDVEKIRIGVTTTSGLKCYDTFLTLEELTYCCKCSSFIPFITHNELLLFYKNKLTLDGGIYYKQLKPIKKETLVISSTMFGRFSKKITEGLKKPKCSYYQLYLNGYHDAKKNHDVLKAYFQV